MGAVRSKVSLTLGAFFQVQGDVITAVDDDDKEVSLRTVCVGTGFVAETGPQKGVPHSHAPAGVKQDLKCPVCHNDAKTSFKKASENAGTFAIVEASAIEAAEVSDDLKLKIDLQVHKREDLVGTVMPGGKAYFFKPRPGQDGPYTLFRRMIGELSDELVYCAVWASRSKPARYQVTTFGDAIALQQIAWPSSLREAPVVDAPISETDLETAKMLSRAAVTPYVAENYVDTRKAALAEAIAKAEGVDGAVLPADDTKAPVAAGGSLSAMLQASLDALNLKPALESVPTSPPKKRAPRKKAAAKVADSNAA